MRPDAVPINVAIVGVQKAATSTLHALLADHPEVARTTRKELHFFDDERRDWGRPDYSRYHGVRTASSQWAAVDATPAYLFWPGALARMRAYDADMPLIASFRDPVERAFSQWLMQKGREASTPGFNTLVLRSLDAGAAQVHPKRLRSRSIVARGFYGHQLSGAFDSFARSQWLLLDFDEVVADQAAVCRRMTDFIGLRALDGRATPVQQRKSAPLPGTALRPPRPSVLTRLAAAYDRDLALFEELSGVSTARWPTRRLVEGSLDVDAWAATFQNKLAGTAP